MADAVEGASAVYIPSETDPRVYVFGGDDGSTGFSSATRIYDVFANSWSTGADLPAARSFMASGYNAANGKIYLVGGQSSPTSVADTTWEYNPGHEHVRDAHGDPERGGRRGRRARGRTPLPRRRARRGRGSARLDLGLQHRGRHVDAADEHARRAEHARRRCRRWEALGLRRRRRPAHSRPAWGHHRRDLQLRPGARHLDGRTEPERAALEDRRHRDRQPSRRSGRLRRLELDRHDTEVLDAATASCQSPTTTYAENFDGVTPPALPTGWTAANTLGDPPLWTTSNSGMPTPPADSPPNAAYIDDGQVASDKRLTSPDIPISTS